MQDKTIIHSIILARGNSKSIKNKNLILIKNKPLLYWSIIRSLKSKKINFTWTSSDNDKILRTAKKFGSLTIKRPKKYSTSKSSSEDAWLHAIKYIQKKKFRIDIVIGLQPTSPIRDKKDFDNAIKFYKKPKLDSLFSSNEILDFNTWKKKNNKLISNYNYLKRSRRQDIKNNFLENGSFYIFKPLGFLKNKNRLFGKIGNFAQRKECGFQLDDLTDLKILKALI